MKDLTRTGIASCVAEETENVSVAIDAVVMAATIDEKRAPAAVLVCIVRHTTEGNTGIGVFHRLSPTLKGRALGLSDNDLRKKLYAHVADACGEAIKALDDAERSTESGVS